MEYHFGICIKECKWGNNQYSYIVVLAGNEKDNEYSLFTKIIEKDEEEKNNLNAIKYGCAVFFTSEGRDIKDLYVIDKLYDYCGESIIRFKFNEEPITLERCMGWCGKGVINIAQKEKELMIALYKGRIYKKYCSSIPEFTAEYIQSVIREEEEFVDSYNIDDMIEELHVSFYASNFYIRTDEPESYKLFEERSYEKTKYEKIKLDSYLFQLLEPGKWLIDEKEGCFFAEEEAEKDVESKYRTIPYVKKEIREKYSKSEHLNYRVRLRLSKFIKPIFDMSAIPGRIIDLDLIRGSNFEFTFFEKVNKEDILPSIKTYPVNRLIEKISKSVQPHKMWQDWLIPFPICTKGNADYDRIFWLDW